MEDTLKRLSIVLQVSPDDLIDWKVQEDKSVLIVLNLSQLGFLAISSIRYYNTINNMGCKKRHYKICRFLRKEDS